MSSALHLPSSPATHDLRRRWLGTRAYWLCQLAGWFGLSLMFLAPLPFYNSSTTYELLNAAILPVTGVPLSHLLRITFLFHLRQMCSWPQLMLRLVPWIIAVSLAQVSVIVWIVSLVANEKALESLTGNEALFYIDNLTLSVPLFTIWSGFYLGLRYYRQYQVALVERLKLDTAIKEAELRSLKAQINPHFLFNSLNTLRALIPLDLAPPREAVTLLSDLLRASLTAGQEETIPLFRELEMVDNYLALERLRFEERLRIRRAIDPAALAWRVPPFFLQTLVENAVKYGLAPSEQGAEITLEARVRGGTLLVRVTNPGTLSSVTASTGLGLKNVQARLRLLFGPSATLHLHQATEELIEAEVLIPGLTTPISP